MDSEAKDGNIDNFLSQLNALNKIISSFKETCKISSYCFDKCVNYPEKSLSNTNKTCIWNCTQRYIECDHFIKKRSKDSGKLSNINLIDEMNASSFGKINN
ncbi:mitochondrial import inner membrane translocase subunit TIM8, putative [Plasmodium berghei]|uniref:Mitochondrial import inner membrane translocase subunit n=2 Tax=Plasmodium berghei TaxID=5821 RepID=A0A509AR80_PLABA|nr:mitochondrial import inner membrane translocase subunit TIM8, putative [Plasmodium berghei ANKA]CXI53127.1 mitochondrial import inner membrane translocase subunit TIM8, putative [Plasmodium berghei]SCL94756.1 mitochondrial import inner membrane translocase subunit TIM8, putative [Plasmodium berghei]SCM16093.1 mitochondrial import inner membrane translocase subunit TIM8, putative [Plasmodium berghei]SCN26213.1 mitochondrial import inner membrane translocase subunit TIM8, putative [Plasmodium |eukprot:XP_034422017.1 mitochondrial import inner membrane translocase subunit TIM8, putative [Plasmodium berghei ANKA]